MLFSTSDIAKKDSKNLVTDCIYPEDYEGLKKANQKKFYVKS